MIPLRVYLKGFLSYRDATELTFDGAPLWVLTGRNGVGKSAIFDAITFALYGVHRNGKQNDDLINQTSENLVVDFDFAIGSNIYRVNRTLPRNGRSTFQAYQLKYPGALTTDQNNCSPISATESKAGLELWVKKTLGIDDRTLTASFLLQQGESEALLKAEPKRRHEILSELVDLSVYKGLETKAKDKFDELDKEAKLKDRQLEQFLSIDESEITELDNQIETGRSELRKIQSDYEKAVELKPYAQNWVTLLAQQEQLEQDITRAEQVVSNAAQVETDKKRFDELDEGLHIMQRLFDERQRLQDCRKQLTNVQDAANQQQESVNVFALGLANAKSMAGALTQQLQQQQELINNALQALSATEGNFHDLQEMERLQADLNTIDKSLIHFPIDLEERISHGQAKVDDLQMLAVALPSLRQYAEARSKWNEAKHKEDEVKVQLESLRRTSFLGKQELEQFETRLVTIEPNVQTLYQVQIETQSGIKQVEAKITRFQKVDGQPQCDYCGQPLTPEHLEAERSRLEAELAVAKICANEARDKYQDILRESQLLKKSINERTAQQNTLNLQIQRNESNLGVFQKNQEQAQSQAEQAFAYLDKEYQQKVGSLPTDDVTLLFLNPYPTNEDLQEINRQEKLLPQYRERLKQRLGEKEQRNDLLSKRQPTEERLQHLRSLYSPEVIQEIITTRQETEAIKRDAEEQIKHLTAEIERGGRILQESQDRYNQADALLQQSLQRLNQLHAQANELQRIVESASAAVPLNWQSIADSFGREKLQEWQQEYDSLQDVTTRLQELTKAKQQLMAYHDRLAMIQNAILDIPEEAKRSTTELQAASEALSDKMRQCQQDLEATKLKKHDLQRQKTEREQLKKEKSEFNKQAQLYKELTKLLGRDHLQNYLLQRVESAIIYNANEVLDHISGGVLRLELKGATSSPSSAKALDIVAYNRQISELPKPLPIAFLSGSQRFRVAVALALGIGRYASHSDKPIESVIIDEGFGGLDEEGRDQMIDELHELKNTLKRIILVSHQEEFAKAFKDNGYKICLENGTSKVSRL